MLILPDATTAAGYDGTGPLAHLLWIAEEMPDLVNVLTFADAPCAGAIPMRVVEADTGETLDLTMDDLPPVLNPSCENPACRPGGRGGSVCRQVTGPGVDGNERSTSSICPGA